MVTPQNPQPLATEEKTTTFGIGADIFPVSIQSRILPFWREYPRLWFAQFEALIEPSKIGDDQKFRYVLSVLQQTDVQQIGDILLNPPTSGKYLALKNRLLSVYQESEAKQLQKLLSGQELGDQKPSQLLRKMRDLGGSMVKDDALKVLWLNQLPTSVRAVLSVSEESSLNTLATMADKMTEHMEPQVAAVTAQNHTTDPNIELLSKQIEKLTLEVAELRGRQSYRRPAHWRGRSRSKSTNGSERKPTDPDWLCRYHYRFRKQARRCESPCAWKKTQPSEN